MVPENEVSSVHTVDLQTNIKPFLDAVALLCCDFGAIVRCQAQNATGDVIRELGQLLGPVKIQVWWRSMRPLKGEIGVASIDLLTFVHERNVPAFHDWVNQSGVRRHA